MLNKISQKCTDVLIKNSIIISEKADIYQYGFELFFSTVFAVLGILVTSVVFNSLETGIIFLLFFIPIRLFAGGFHASTYGWCFVCTNMVYLLVLVMTQLVFNRGGFLFSAAAFAFSVIYIWFTAPVEHPDAPLGEPKRLKNRSNARKILLLEVSCLIILFLLKGYQIVYTAVLTTTVVALMMIIAKDRR